MGIDIRNGPQLECINCGLCIDACDEIMLKVGRPRALIAYDTDSAVAARHQGAAARYRLIRPRTLYYAIAVTAVSGLMLAGLMSRTPIDLHVVRDRNPMFVRLHDGTIRNGYTLKISNRTFQPRTYGVTFAGVPGAVLKTPGAPAAKGELSVVVDPDGVRAVRVFVSGRPAEAAPAMQPAAFAIQSGGRRVEARTVFATGAAGS
jgi:polyferredoxin